MIDFSKVITAEQQESEKRAAALEGARSSRRAAFASESDPLRFEADYDAIIARAEPDYSAWLSAVAAIKQRYPLPADEN